MYRGQQSHTEVDDIWHEKGKCMGTLQSQQLQMATERSSLVGITAKKEVRNLKNPHNPHLVMHLSMEDMILSQMDLIWENYIVSEYNSHHSHDSWPPCTFIPTESSSSGPHILYEHGMELCKTSVGNIGFSSSCYSDFTVEMHCQVKEMICKSSIQGAMTMKNPWRKRRLSAQLDSAEKRAKRSLNITRCAESSPYFMSLNEKTNVDFIPENQDKFVKPCRNIEASLEKNPSLPMLRSAQDTCCNVKACSKMSDDGCYFRSVLKSLVISSSSLGVTEEVFSSTFIPQPDSSVDYTKLCASLQQKGRCKVPDDSDESLCLTNNSDSNINLHVKLSAHPCILTSDVILSDVNSAEPGEWQGQNCFNWAAGERRTMPAEMATLKSLQTNKSSLLCIDKRNSHLGNNDKPLLPRGKTFSTQLNYPRRPEEQHFLQDINFSILEASLLGTSKYDFSFLHITDSQSVSQRESSSETTDESFSLKYKSLKSEQAEVEVSIGTGNLNNSGGRAHLDYKTALSKQDFCFPSYFQNGDDTKQSQKETSGNNTDFYMRPTCSKQVSYTERFTKICLESESSNSEEAYCSFRRDLLFYKSRSRQDNMNTIENKPSERKSKYQNIKQQHKHQPYTEDTEDKKIDKESLSKNMNGDAANHRIVGDSAIEEKVIKDAEQVDITFNNLDGEEKENQYVKFQILDELLDTNPSVYVETAVNENSQQECAPIKYIKREESFTKENTDAFSKSSKVLVKNTDFVMKAQFDLVLEELKVFHTIEEEKVEHMKTERGNRLEGTCSNTEVIQDAIKEDFPSKKVIDGGDSEVSVIKEELMCKTKITSEASEQEVPQQYMSNSPGDDESLYSADNVEDIPKSPSWTPAFLKSSDREVGTASYSEKAVTFSHGIGRVTPLKTRTGPLRIGLSKKAKIKQLHPYLR